MLTWRAGWNPGYLDIEGLEVRGAYRGDAGGLTYTNSQGFVTPYDYGGDQGSRPSTARACSTSPATRY